MDLRYPIGPFKLEGAVTPELREEFIGQIANTPDNVRAAIQGLTPEQIDSVYRPEGWTVRQVVHHMADSHLNSFVRFKLALTEDAPNIKSYYEDRWASWTTRAKLRLNYPWNYWMLSINDGSYC